MSKTVRKFRGKVYRQGHTPLWLVIERSAVKHSAESAKKRLDKLAIAELAEAAAREQEEMGYGSIG